MYKVGDKVKLVPYTEIPDWDKISSTLRNAYLLRQGDVFFVSEVGVNCYNLCDLATGHKVPFAVKALCLVPYCDEKDKEIEKEFATLIF